MVSLVLLQSKGCRLRRECSGWGGAGDMRCCLPRQLPAGSSGVPTEHCFPTSARILAPDYCPVWGRFHSVSASNRLRREKGRVWEGTPLLWSLGVTWKHWAVLLPRLNWARALRSPERIFPFFVPKNHLKWEVGFCLCKTHQDLPLSMPTPRQSCLPCFSLQWLETMS